VLESVTKTLKNGGTVSLVGFGSFGVTKRKARTGRNSRMAETGATQAFNAKAAHAVS